MCTLAGVTNTPPRTTVRLHHHRSRKSSRADPRSRKRKTRPQRKRQHYEQPNKRLLRRPRRWRKVKMMTWMRRTKTKHQNSDKKPHLLLSSHVLSVLSSFHENISLLLQMLSFIMNEYEC